MYVFTFNVEIKVENTKAQFLCKSLLCKFSKTRSTDDAPNGKPD